MKRCSKSYVIREMQIKTIMRCHYILIRMVKTQTTDKIKCWWGCGATGTLTHCWLGMQNGTATSEDYLEVSYKVKHSLTTWSSDSIPGYLPKGVENLCPHKNLHADIFSTFSHYCQNLEATEMSFSRWTDNKLWYIQQWNIIQC